MRTNHNPTRSLSLMCLLAVLAIVSAFESHAQESAYLIGRGKTDITGPAVGMQMWGFVREGQITAGLHFRLHARAFVIAEPNSNRRIAFVSADLGSITHAIHREVVEILRVRVGSEYTMQNVVISATHTHSGPGGYWHYGVDSPLGGAFYQEHFSTIVTGIVNAIIEAHEDLAPGSILINHGTVDGAGANRSVTAYENNPEDERGKYNSDTDKEMTLLKFVRDGESIGVLNWFAVHPTAMTFNNRLISGDHKGHASMLFEHAAGPNFVAAFAQSNCGDVTANLNLDNTGPGVDEFDTTRIIGERQFEAALELSKNASEEIRGSIDYRQTFIDLSNVEVGDRFTKSGTQNTCPSAYGYSFAAGSTEDGGGHPMFKEGMTIRNKMIDNLVKEQFGFEPPPEELYACQAPKAILFATGTAKPYPLVSQIVPISVLKIGQLTLACVPAEFTTMAGRRLRETVAEAMGDGAGHVVLAGYANDYAGYVTTREEYETQQYEGGHTVFGPWTLAAYRQEVEKLARALAGETPVEAGPMPRDLRRLVESTALRRKPDVAPTKGTWESAAEDVRGKYRKGDEVTVVFWSGYLEGLPGLSYFSIQNEADGRWQTVATDDDWSTKLYWQEAESPEAATTVKISWVIPKDAAPGTYRIAYFGSYRDGGGERNTADALSKTFRVR